MYKLISRFLWKIRLVFRAIYASLSKENARKLVHQIDLKEHKIKELRGKLERSHVQNRRLHQRNEGIKDSYESKFEIGEYKMLTELEDLRYENLSLKDKLREGNNSFGWQNQLIPKQQFERTRSSNDNLKTKLKSAIEFNRTYGVLLRYIAQESNLNVNAFKVLQEHKYDLVIAHDILGLGAARSLADHFGADFTVDIVEEYNLMTRSGSFFRNNLSSSDAVFINAMIRNTVLTAQKHLHIGPRQMKAFKKSTARDGTFLPNFRNAFQSSPEIKAEADAILSEMDLLGKDFVCVPNRVINSNEITALMGGLALAKYKLPIVHVGAELTDIAAAEVAKVSESKGIPYISLGLLEYDVYREVLSRAQFCSFITQETVDNLRFAFPNRLFDAISTQTPILVAGFEQVGNFVRKKGIGVYLDEKQTLKNFGIAISNLRASTAEIAKKLKRQSKVCSWDKVFNDAFSDVDKDQRVLIITRKDVRKNQRIQNLRNSFLAKGCITTVMGGHKDLYEISDKDFYTVPLTRHLTEEDLYSNTVIRS